MDEDNWIKEEIRLNGIFMKRFGYKPNKTLIALIPESNKNSVIKKIREYSKNCIIGENIFFDLGGLKGMVYSEEIEGSEGYKIIGEYIKEALVKKIQGEILPIKN